MQNGTEWKKPLDKHFPYTISTLQIVIQKTHVIDSTRYTFQISLGHLLNQSWHIHWNLFSSSFYYTKQTKCFQLLCVPCCRLKVIKVNVSALQLITTIKPFFEFWERITGAKRIKVYYNSFSLDWFVLFGWNGPMGSTNDNNYWLLSPVLYFV